MRLNVLFYEDQSPSPLQTRSELSHSLGGNSDLKPPDDQNFIAIKIQKKEGRGTEIDRRRDRERR